MEGMVDPNATSATGLISNTFFYFLLLFFFFSATQAELDADFNRTMCLKVWSLCPRVQGGGGSLLQVPW